MLTLLSERFAPTTSDIGFIEGPLEEVAQVFEGWQREIKDHVRVTKYPDASLPEVMERLQPLVTASRTLEALVRAGSRWTAYFDNGWHNGDPHGFARVMARRMDCRAVTLSCSPHTAGLAGPGSGRMGGVQFAVHGLTGTESASSSRSISATADRSWRFEAFGPQLDFEEPEAYTKRRVRDRFTSHMLERYCRALGIDPFNPDFYGPGAIIYGFKIKGAKKFISGSRAESQRAHNIIPGLADDYPG